MKIKPSYAAGGNVYYMAATAGALALAPEVVAPVEGIGMVVEAAAAEEGLSVGESSMLADDTFWNGTEQKMRQGIWNNLSDEERANLVNDYEAAQENELPSKSWLGQIKVAGSTMSAIGAAIAAIFATGTIKQEDYNPDATQTMNSSGTLPNSTVSVKSYSSAYYQVVWPSSWNQSLRLNSLNGNLPDVQSVTYTTTASTASVTATFSDGQKASASMSMSVFNDWWNGNETGGAVTTTDESIDTSPYKYTPDETQQDDYTSNPDKETPLEVPMPNTVDETGQQGIDYAKGLMAKSISPTPDADNYNMPDQDSATQFDVNSAPDSDTSALQKIWEMLDRVWNVVRDPIGDTSELSDSTSKLKSTFSQFKVKFPFSLPWDTYNAFDSVFGGISEGDLPDLQFSWTAPGFDTVNLDFKIPQELANWLPLMRDLIVITFDVSMIYVLRKWFGGAS